MLAFQKKNRCYTLPYRLKNHHYKVKNDKACCQKYCNKISTCKLSNKFVFEIDLTILKSHEKKENKI